MADAAARRAFVAQYVGSDLAYILDDSAVGEQLQYDLAQHYTSVRRFSSMGDDRASVRAAVAADYALDPGMGPATRSQLAAVVSAWESSRDYIETDNRLKAEARVLGTPRALSTGDKIAMRKAVESAHGLVPDKECPANTYLQSKLEELEEGELVAAPLDEVVSRADGAASSLDLSPSLDSAGRLRVTKAKTKVHMPNTTEEYRTKLKVECNAWLMISSKFRNKSVLQDLLPSTFEQFTSYILGERVHLLQVPDEAGTGMKLLQPPWQLTLNYEYALRKEAFKRVAADPAGLTIAAALEAVTHDAELKDLYFTCPLALSMKRAPAAPVISEEWGSQKKRKGLTLGVDAFNVFGPQRTSGEKGGKSKVKAKKAKGKGRGGKDGKDSGKGLAYQTADGRRICFRFNSGDPCDGSCGMVHVCRIRGCAMDHPMVRHSPAVTNG
jgi:hypothetical protein